MNSENDLTKGGAAGFVVGGGDGVGGGFVGGSGGDGVPIIE